MHGRLRARPRRLNLIPVRRIGAALATTDGRWAAVSASLSLLVACSVTWMAIGTLPVSGPLVGDTLAARLSTSLTRRGGTIYDTTSQSYLQKLDNFSVRGQLLWKPRSDLDFRLTGDFNVQNPLCCVQYYVGVGSTQRPASRQYTQLAAALGYTVPSTNPFDRVTDLDASINSRQEMGGASLVGDWDIGPATITSVSAWRYWDWKPANDRDFVGLPITTVSQNPAIARG